VLRTNQLSERILCVRAWMECCLYFLHFLYSLDKIRNRIHPQNMLSNSKFHENQCCESHTLLRDVKFFTHVHSTFIISFGWNLVQRIWKYWAFVYFVKICRGKAMLFVCTKWYYIYMCTNILSIVSTSTPLLQHRS
jgi:hypothetical protein